MQQLLNHGNCTVKLELCIDHLKVSDYLENCDLDLFCKSKKRPSLFRIDFSQVNIRPVGLVGLTCTIICLMFVLEKERHERESQAEEEEHEAMEHEEYHEEQASSGEEAHIEEQEVQQSSGEEGEHSGTESESDSSDSEDSDSDSGTS